MDPPHPDNPDALNDPPAGEPDHVPIQLEPMVAHDPHGGTASDAADYSPAFVPPPSVPDWPLHLCPYCDYILAGLTTYRCPECGQPFTLIEARQRAIMKSPEVRRLFYRALLMRFGGVIGVTLFLAAAALPVVLADHLAQPRTLNPASTTMVVWSFLATLLISGVLVVFMLEIAWPRALLITGLLAVGISLAVCFL